MSNSICVINEQEVFGKQFRVYGSVDEPLFLAKDVATWIEHTNVTSMVDMVDENEKRVLEPSKDCLVGDFQANTSYTFLTEDGLYEVLMLSRKPIAKQFKSKVKEILKTLRKTGSYSITKTNMDIAIYSDDPLERGKAIVAMLEEERAKQALIEARADKAEEAKAIAEKKAEDLTEAFSRSIVSDNDKLYSTFIKELKMTTPCASSILKELKVFGKNGHLSDYGDWFKIKVSDNWFPARFVTPIGQMMLVNLFNANRDKMRAIGGTYRYIKPSDRCQIIKLPEDVCKNF